MNIDKENRKKLDSKAQKLYFIRYGVYGLGYRFTRPKKKLRGARFEAFLLR